MYQGVSVYHDVAVYLKMRPSNHTKSDFLEASRNDRGMVWLYGSYMIASKLSKLKPVSDILRDVDVIVLPAMQLKP